MAVLRQVAFVPSSQERMILAGLSGPLEIWQRPRLYGNLPTSCYLKTSDEKWFLIYSRSEDIEFKFECISLAIKSLPESPKDTEVVLVGKVYTEQLMVLFRAEWRKPHVDDNAGDDWTRIMTNLALVDEVPTPSLAGCLSWSGLLFGTPESPAGLVYLDDFPLSVGYSNDHEPVAKFVKQCRVIRHCDVTEWIARIRGWEIETMSEREPSCGPVS